MDERPDPRPLPNVIRLAQALRVEHDVVSGRHDVAGKTDSTAPAEGTAADTLSVDPTIGDYDATSGGSVNERVRDTVVACLSQ